jgi:hypothetical protein
LCGLFYAHGDVIGIENKESSGGRKASTTVLGGPSEQTEGAIPMNPSNTDMMNEKARNNDQHEVDSISDADVRDIMSLTSHQEGIHLHQSHPPLNYHGYYTRFSTCHKKYP